MNNVVARCLVLVQRTACLAGVIAVFLSGNLTNAQGDDRANALWNRFQSQLDSIVTCEIAAEHYANKRDYSKMSSFCLFRRQDDRVRFDELYRVITPEGVIDEVLNQRYFDGRSTVRIVANYPGLPREYSPHSPKGIRCLVDAGMTGLARAFDDSIGLLTFANGDVEPYGSAYKKAVKKYISKENEKKMYSSWCFPILKKAGFMPSGVLNLSLTRGTDIGLLRHGFLL